MSQSYDPQRLPVPVAAAERAGRKPSSGRKAASDAAPFAAQVMGQDGARRGLRGGEPVLNAARAAYLETEWSGPDDRRLAKGLLRKTEI